MLNGPKETHYSDPGLQARENPGELLEAEESSLYGMIEGMLSDRDAFRAFLGQYLSQCKYDIKPEPCADDPFEVLHKDDTLEIFSGSRVMYTHRPDGIQFFINGSAMAVSVAQLSLVQLLSKVCIPISWASLCELADGNDGMNFLKALPKWLPR